jgi:hypothetical protein
MRWFASSGSRPTRRPGGAVRRDLFDDEHSRFLSDPGLLQRLASEKLEGLAAAIRAEICGLCVVHCGMAAYLTTLGRRCRDADDEPRLRHPEAGTLQGDCDALRGLRRSEVTTSGATRASHGPAAPPSARWRPGSLRASPARANHAVPPGAAACGDLLRRGRGGLGCEPAIVHQGRVRRLPRMRHPGARLPSPALRVLQVVHRVLTRFLLKQAGLKPDQANSGAVTLIQRLGSAANLNIHPIFLS